MRFEMSPKQIQSYAESTARINIWEGSIRSGKTFASALRFINFIRHGPPGAMAIIGKNASTVKRNVISTFEQIFGDELTYNRTLGELKLWNRLIHIVGANDERAETKIRGGTFAGALVDEVTLVPQSFFSTLLGRLSVEGAKLFGTTNPDSPFHWLKIFLDRPDLQDQIKRFHFTLHDNPSLSPDYIKNISREFSGMWYKRFIDGDWVMADGTVFSMFDEQTHVIPAPPGNAEYYIVGIDYGTANPTAFSLIGVNEQIWPNVWLEKEYYWDSRVQRKQKTDADYAKDLREFIRGFPVRCIYLDPSAASFRIELQRQSIPIHDAKNEVLDGIRLHSMFLDVGKFKICRSCKNTIQEYGSYIWDMNAQKKGEDKPLKEHDHLMDSIRYALYTHFFMSGGRRLSANDIDIMYSESRGDSQQNHGKFFEDRAW